MDSRTRFIADSRCFSGVCQTIMLDGLHSDSSGETLEELRIRKDNPYITALSPRQMEKRMRLYRQALCAPFEEITKKEYLERLNVLPPIRKREDSFFLSEPITGNWPNSALHGKTGSSRESGPSAHRKPYWTRKWTGTWN